ncbi:hypothetical protein [Methylococcus capsulatus]|uniref:hypothetical protein n=1 Tax=Methylococcus capsulatus TaxID=414 RepID=UPI00117F11BE|nr:hypothetical protein [Methylococcus capsulatus]
MTLAPEPVCLLSQADAMHGMMGTLPFTPPDRARFSAERTESPFDLARRVDADRPRSGIGRGGAVGGTPAAEDAVAGDHALQRTEGVPHLPEVLCHVFLQVSAAAQAQHHNVSMAQ